MPVQSQIRRNRALDKSHHHAVVVGYGGIGKALVDALLAQSDQQRVSVISRQKISEQSDPRMASYVVDYDSNEALTALFDTLAPFDLLINTVGVLHGEDLQPEKRLAQFEPKNFQRSLAINTQISILLAQQVERVCSRKSSTVLAALSARVGSITDNHSGGWLSYRVSKAALNMAIKTISLEWARTRPSMAIVALHPGTVDTGLSQPFQSRVPEQQLFTPALAATHLLSVIETLDATHSGQFLAWDGSEIAW
jgi:NAD(P)-dependent dehydrogenase (short-subunit alcohol dehydrogenase family)